MSINNPYSFLNIPAFDVLRRRQEQFNNSAPVVAMRELQRTIDTSDITVAVRAYKDSIASLTATMQSINNLYAPILKP